MTTQTEAAALPENVLARYVTAVGAAVDITHTSHSCYVIATCSGCEVDEYTPTGGRVDDPPEAEDWRVDQVLPKARTWAQSHAETCRAISEQTP